MRFVDSSFWIGLLILDDQHHQTAVRLWAMERQPLLTTNHVVGETWTFLRRRQGHRSAVDFVEGVVRSPKLTIVRVDEDAERDVWVWRRRHDERVYSFVDATSFAVMRRLRIREALAFDGDFSAANFTEARP
jgi:predicted nucleic acid-binding protein